MEHDDLDEQQKVAKEEQRKAIDRCLSKYGWKLGSVSLTGGGSIVVYELIRDDGFKSMRQVLVAEIARWSLIPRVAPPPFPNPVTIALVALLLDRVVFLNSANPRVVVQ